LIVYELPEGELQVLYSGGKCVIGDKEGYDLGEGVIVSYRFF
jgi:hypothetical protein